MLKKLLAKHDALRDKAWEVVTKPNPPAEKFLAWLPRTDHRVNRVLHQIDDGWVAVKNRLQAIERHVFAKLLWLIMALVLLLAGLQVAAWVGIL